MKGMKIVPWFLFILCTHALSTSALPSLFKFEKECVNLTRPLVQGQNIPVGRLDRGGDDTFKLYGVKHEMEYSSKGQRGKGGIGGSNVAHEPRRTDKSSAPSMVVRPLQIIFALILGLLFQ